MTWRHLLFENWPVDPSVLDTHLPDGLEPDVYDGSAWLSVGPFANEAIRPKWLPERLGLRLPELNLRTYVTCDGVPGVYFFSLDAQGVLGVVGARLFHHLPYYYARASLTVEDGRVHFESRRRHPGSRPVQFDGRYWPAGEPFAAPDDPFASFLVERYRFYAKAQDDTTRYATVSHEPWTLYPAAVDIEQNTLLSAHGVAEPEAEPVYFYSPGVDVDASRSARL